MASNFGLQFAPPTQPDRAGQRAASAQLGPAERAVQVLSLHLPRILGARAIAPAALLAPDRGPAGPISPEAALAQNAIKAQNPLLPAGAQSIASQLADILASGTAFDTFAPRAPDLTNARPIPTDPAAPAPSGPKTLPPSSVDTTPRVVVNEPGGSSGPEPAGFTGEAKNFAGPSPNAIGIGPTVEMTAPLSGPNVYTAPGAADRLAGGVQATPEAAAALGSILGGQPLTVEEIMRRFSPSAIRMLTRG